MLTEVNSIHLSFGVLTSGNHLVVHQLIVPDTALGLTQYELQYKAAFELTIASEWRDPLPYMAKQRLDLAFWNN